MHVARTVCFLHATAGVRIIAARLQGRGPWKKRLPQIIDTLIAVGRVRAVEGGKGYVIQ
jgi:hypothetical protein